MSDYVTVTEAAKYRADVVRDTIYEWAVKGHVRAVQRGGVWYVNLDDVKRRKAQHMRKARIPRGLTRRRLEKEVRESSQTAVGKRYGVSQQVVKRWMKVLGCQIKESPRRELPRSQGYNLRSLPDMIEMFDHMDDPPQTIEEARPWAEFWQREERKRWEGVNGVSSDYADLAALSITPWYILSIVRTKKYRMRPREKHSGYTRQPVRQGAR